MPSIGGSTFVVYIVYGPYTDEFRTFSLALKQVLFLMLGQLNTEVMFKTNSVVAVFWTFAFYFFLIFIFMSMFLSIFLEAYEMIVRSTGYPEDYEEQTQWAYKDYLYWILDWLP